MIDIRSIANNAIQKINEDVFCILKSSNGYTIGEGRKQIPSYIESSVLGNFQALDGDDLKQIDGMNLQGVIRAVYLRGLHSGVVRQELKGGDLLTDNLGVNWLITKVLETWNVGTGIDWCKVVVVRQDDV